MGTNRSSAQPEEYEVIRTRPPRAQRLPVLAVCIASVALGTFFGGCAGAAYSLPVAESHHYDHLVPVVWAVGLGVGGVGGLVVAAAWCASLTSRARRLGSGLLKHGTLRGILAGVACTLLVHIPLILIVPRNHGMGAVAFPVGLLIGAATGAILGAIGGKLMQRMADAGSPADEAPRAPSASEGCVSEPGARARG